MWDQESLREWLYVFVCACVCVFTCALIALADMASCLVRLITPQSAALGSMCWRIPQQRSSWPGDPAWSMTDYWCSQLLAPSQWGGKEKVCVYAFVWAWYKTGWKKQNKSWLHYILYRNAAMVISGFQRGSSYVMLILHAKFTPPQTVIYQEDYEFQDIA